jgi:hypothetical protein
MQPHILLKDEADAAAFLFFSVKFDWLFCDYLGVAAGVAHSSGGEVSLFSFNRIKYFGVLTLVVFFELLHF